VASAPYAVVLPDPLAKYDYCAWQADLSAFFDVMVGAVRGFDYANVHEHVLAGNVADATLLAVGGALVMAPVLFGKNWFAYVLFILGCLAGAVATSTFLPGSPVFPLLAPYVVFDAAGQCLASLVLVVLGGLLAGTILNCVKSIAFFAVGFFGAGFGAWAASGLVVPLMQEFLTPKYGVEITPEYVDIACAVLALLGGLILCKCGLALVDTVLGLLGSFFVGLGALNLASLDLIDAATATKLQLGEFYMYYVLGIALVVEILRCTLVCCREGSKEAAPAHPAPKPAGKVSPAGKGGKPAAKPAGKAGAKRMM